MAQRIEQVRETTDDGNITQTTARTASVADVDDGAPQQARADGQTIAQRLVWYVAGVLITLLAFRFALTLLGANQSNGFANFIYSASHPFVAPFFGLFGYDLQYGISRFETFTLVAIAVYALIAFGISKLLGITKR